MGMPVSVHLRGPGVRTAPVQEQVLAAFAGLRRADALFSTYRADSEVSRLRRGALTLSACDPLVREVAALCEEAHERTGGAFTALLPDLGGVLRFDPTGLVKGWAVDRAATLLAAIPGHAYCLNAGGDVAVGGAAGDDPDPRPWRIGIEDPGERSRVAEVVQLWRGALATSGNAARGAHIFDPAAGQWVHREGSASVVGPTLLWADVWATVLFLGGDAAQQRFAGTAPGYRSIMLPRPPSASRSPSTEVTGASQTKP